jgi:hypothetical protein
MRQAGGWTSRGRRAGALTGALVAGLVTLASIATAAPVAAAGPLLFQYTTPGEHQLVIPAGVDTLHAVLVGGRGGSGYAAAPTVPAHGGFGAKVVADVAVVPGQVIYVLVGGNGDSGQNGSNGAGGNPGYNGGGRTSGYGNLSNGGAGGASVLQTATEVYNHCPDGLVGGPPPGSTLLAIAGGGGSGGGAMGSTPGGIGGNAGSPAQDGAGGGTPGTPGGGGGSGSNGGAGGAGAGGNALAPGFNGSPGCGGFGGRQVNGPDGGGGGGGGLLGGGGGGAGDGSRSGGGGGGGGSSAGPANAAITTDTTGVPSVTLTATPVETPNTGIPVPAVGAAGPQGELGAGLLVAGLVLNGAVIGRRRSSRGRG